jgi:PBP1b-binding outer membrane lipoprotein LpoB
MKLINMKKRQTYSAIFFCFMIITLSSCQPKEEKTDSKAEVKAADSNSTVHGSVHKINLVNNEPTFPDVEGRDLFLNNCMTCHTTRYISMQPNFPRKTWQAEVTKMIEKFHAPIDTNVGKKIVDYLVKIKGV